MCKKIEGKDITIEALALLETITRGLDNPILDVTVNLYNDFMLYRKVSHI